MKKNAGFQKKSRIIIKKKSGDFTSVESLDRFENGCFYIWENGTSDVKSPI
jgi:hypothetical protein